jgi:hypothetical protein
MAGVRLQDIPEALLDHACMDGDVSSGRDFDSHASVPYFFHADFPAY